MLPKKYRRIVPGPASQFKFIEVGLYGANPIWANPSDHTKTFGKSAQGYFLWRLNMWMFTNYGTTLQLWDKDGNILSSASYSIGTFPYPQTVTYDTNHVLEFNALNIISPAIVFFGYIQGAISYG